MGDYPNPQLLVQVDWLKEHLDDGHQNDAEIRILDVRASDPRLPIGYRMGHIPGAIALDPTRSFFIFANGAPELAAPEEIARSLANRGISNDTPVVIYDEWTGELAALTYWVLRYVGHSAVEILNGGWAFWKNGGGPVSRDEPQVTPVTYRPEPNMQARANAEWIQSNLGRADLLLLDARTPDEYAMGHLPGAVNLSYDSALEQRTQTFKNAEDLRSQLQSVGATPDKEIVTYCSAGARSAHLFTTLELLGYPRVRNYDGSMIDWYQLRGLPLE